MDGTLKVQVYDKDTHIDNLLGECEVNLLEHVDIKVSMPDKCPQQGRLQGIIEWSLCTDA